MMALSESIVAPYTGVNGSLHPPQPPAGPFHPRAGEGVPPGLLKIDTSFSRGLSEWVLRQGVSFICSTYQTGHLICIGAGPEGRVMVSAACFRDAMGLVADQQRIFLASSKAIWRLENILGSHESANEIYDRLYVPRNIQFTGDLDAHEMALEASGRLVFVNTKYSCLATVSMTQAFAPIWKPNFISRLAPEDRCHLNGLALEDGKVRYVTACSTADVVDGWRDHREAGGVLIDVTNDEIVCDGLSMPHSPRVVGDHVYFLESGRGALVRYDRTTGRRDDVTIIPGFARGLSIRGDFAAVTLSLPREAASFQALAVAKIAEARGATAWCGIQIVDLRGGDIVQWIRFDSGVRELFDVALVPGVRCARALGPEAADMAELVRYDASK